MTFETLKDRIKAQGRGVDMDLITRAFEKAQKAHEGQHRLSGEPYIEHPLNVALLLVELGMDTACIVAALLHDVVEDTDTTLETIKKQFGGEVAELVDGLTKLGAIAFSSVAEQQAENLRKMLLAMSNDIRVMIIKLCDRLHNLRTLDVMPVEKQLKKALETMEVYAPIAYRLGMKKLKEELEDRSLYYLDRFGYSEITEALGNTGKTREYMEMVTEHVRQRVLEGGIENAEFESRIKSVYGIYRKMFLDGKEFDEIYDIYALRVIVENVGECYNVLGIIHDLYHPVPNRFKDYISTPKPNLYRSLHTTIVGPGGTPVEVQIRTFEMHRTAELGVAAHWKYKAGVTDSSKGMEERLAWVRRLIEQDDVSDDEEILQNIKHELVPQEVYVFTPRGDVITLPTGSTAIDFAYAIHSQVGNRMVGAKIGGKLVSIDHKLENGEIIEVVTGSENKGPGRDWLNIVRTSEARNKIRTWFKKERKEENIEQGRDMLDKEMRRAGITLTKDEREHFLHDIAKKLRINSVDELYASLGYGGITLAKLMSRAKEDYAKLVKAKSPVEIFAIPEKKETSSEGVVVEGIDNCLVKFAKCCGPLPGDDIVGFITRGHGVAIHKMQCANYQRSKDVLENSPRWLSAHWASEVRDSFNATLEISALNRNALLADITVSLANMHVPIVALIAREKESGNFANFLVTISVTNLEHLNSVVTKLRKVRDVQDIIRR